MAIRKEDLERREARIYRFPSGPVRARVRRRRMLVRRRRTGLALVAVVVVVATLFGGGSSVASRPEAPAAVTIRAGDTLWELAGRYAPPGIDRRAYVDAVVALNGLSGAPRAGQRLRLPH